MISFRDLPTQADAPKTMDFANLLPSAQVAQLIASDGVGGGLMKNSPALLLVLLPGESRSNGLVDFDELGVASAALPDRWAGLRG